MSPSNRVYQTWLPNCRFQCMNCNRFLGEIHKKSYGYPLWIVYLVWIGVVAILYPIRKKYIIYKLGNKEKWWLSYL